MPPENDRQDQEQTTEPLSQALICHQHTPVYEPRCLMLALLYVTFDKNAF